MGLEPGVSNMAARQAVAGLFSRGSCSLEKGLLESLSFLFTWVVY